MKFKKYLPYIFLFMLFLTTLAVNMQIGLFGDDYYYATFTRENFGSMHLNHYQEANGRAIVHILDTLFLAMPHFVWAIFNSFLLTMIAYMSSKIVALFNNNNESFCLKTIITFLFGILMLNIWVIRQSVYWITGSFNYVYPCFMLLWYMYVLFKNFKNDFKGNQILLTILAFFTAATVEQAAMMAFGLTLLLLFYMLIKGEKYKPKNILILLAISFLGMATLIFAPSQFIRIGLETDENVSIFETIKNNLLFLIKDYAPEYAYHIIVAMISVISFFLFNGKRSKITSDDIFLLIAIFILGTGSQIMMFVSPVYGERNTIFIAFMLMLFTGFMFSKISFKLQKVLHGISISFYGILIIVSLINIYDIYKKYKISNNIQNQNILAINEYKLSNNTNTLYLKKLEDEKYGWSMPYNSPYHEQWFKIYYKIKDTNIVWID